MIASRVLVPEKSLYPFDVYENATVWICPFLVGQVPFSSAYSHS